MTKGILSANHYSVVYTDLGRNSSLRERGCSKYFGTMGSNVVLGRRRKVNTSLVLGDFVMSEAYKAFCLGPGCYVDFLLKGVTEWPQNIMDGAE